MIILPNGIIQLDAGEKLPASLVEKYALVPGETRIYEIIFPDCQYHDLAVRINKVCKKRTTMDHCSLKDIFISPKICQKCIRMCENGILNTETR